MCNSCPKNIRDMAINIAKHRTEYHDGFFTGGLHIVLEDENVEAEHILWCMYRPDPLDPECLAIALGLLNMSIVERHMAVQWSNDVMEREMWEEEEKDAEK